MASRVAEVHWTTYLSAFGGLTASVTAVGIALWTILREKSARPRLWLGYRHDLGEDFAVGVMDGTQHWVRLRVHNRKAGRSGRRSADDVEVLVFLASRDGVSLSQLEGCAFNWSNAFDVEHRPLTRLTIPPGVARRFDLLSIAQPVVSDGGGGFRAVDDEGAPGARAELQVQPKPGDCSHHLKPGSHSLYVVVTARDSDAAYYDVTINFDGKWRGGDAIRDHLSVTIEGVKMRDAG